MPKDDGKEVKCAHCGYKWPYSGALKMATCPSCQKKTKTAIFEDLPRPMRFLMKEGEGPSAMPVGYIGVCLGEVPEGFRELTDEEKKKYFGVYEK